MRGIQEDGGNSNCTFVPDFDFDGGDLNPSHSTLPPPASTMQARCCAMCTAQRGCHVAVLSGPTDSPPSACWLKTKDALLHPKYKPGVQSCWPTGTPIPPSPAPPPTPPPPPPQCYAASVVSFDRRPVLSHVDGTSSFGQVFNPSWVQASPGTGGKSGLLVRSQVCFLSAAAATTTARTPIAPSLLLLRLPEPQLSPPLQPLLNIVGTKSSRTALLPSEDPASIALVQARRRPSSRLPSCWVLTTARPRRRFPPLPMPAWSLGLTMIPMTRVGNTLIVAHLPHRSVDAGPHYCARHEVFSGLIGSSLGCRHRGSPHRLRSEHRDLLYVLHLLGVRTTRPGLPIESLGFYKRISGIEYSYPGI